MTSIVWFRRDLRVHDHPALRAAGADVVPLFVFDDRLLRGRHSSGPRTRFLLEALADLDAALKQRGSGLLIRRGAPERELAEVAREAGAETVHFSADVSPFARARGERVAAALDGVELHAHPGLFAVDAPGTITTRDGRPQTVFTHYHRAWLGADRREVLGAPRSLDPLPRGLRKGRLPKLADLGLADSVPDPMPGGEEAGRARMNAWLRGPVREYVDGHEDLGSDSTSRLSPYLRLGCVSARELEDRLGRGAGAEAFRRQLCWRDFYAQLLLHHPQNARLEFREKYRGAIRWSTSRRRLEAWQEGRTGFPLVDAGMRQLRHEGFMHNRARLVVGSFLTKDLAIDWREGERWFMRWLLDGDEANNNGNWQWIASVGVDPQPAYRRIYNPALHQERHDPDNAYVRRWVPELAGVPDRYLREPATMPEEVQREVGCVIGTDYPRPIVDHAEARREALDRYRV